MVVGPIPTLGITHFNPIRLGLFSRSPGPGGGLVRGPDAKIQGHPQPIEIKFCIIAIKACLMQNLILLPSVALEI